MSKPRPAFKAWLQTDEGYVFGPGAYSLLKKVKETGTLKEAAESLGMSYRYAWGLVKRAEETLGQPLLTAHKGGRSGGGGAELTDVGSRFLEEFSQIESVITELLSIDILATNLGPKNQVEGVIEEIIGRDKEADVLMKLDPEARLTLRLPMKIIDSGEFTEGSRLSVELFPLVSLVKGLDDSKSRSD